MKISSFALAAALAVAGAAQADDLVNNVNLAGNGGATLSGSFGVTHLDMGEFEDTFNFSPTNGSWSVDASLVTIGFQPASNINFYSAEINGHALSMSPNGVFEYSWLVNEPVTGPLVMTVYGSVEGPMGGASASYSGTVNISAVPEPATYGMLLGGIGILAWLGRRKPA